VLPAWKRPTPEHLSSDRSLAEMNKRLRKKKHLGEFTKWGRQLIAYRNTTANADNFHDAFILDAVEANGCSSGGSLSVDKLDVVIELGLKSSDPDSKFEKVTKWLDGRADVDKWKSGPLFDTWHGDFNDINEESEQTAGGASGPDTTCPGTPQH